MQLNQEQIAAALTEILGAVLTATVKCLDAKTRKLDVEAKDVESAMFWKSAMSEAELRLLNLQIEKQFGSEIDDDDPNDDPAPGEVPA